MSAPVRDKLYLPLIATHLVGILALDLLPFYPPALYQSPSSPLHALVALRTWWTRTSHDPFLSASPPEPWFEALLGVEALVQLPLAAYLVWRLARGGRRASGATEMAGLVYGCVTAVGALLCCVDLWEGGAERVGGPEGWARLFWGAYLPFCVVPSLMACDMYLRLLGRVTGGRVVGKTRRV